MDRSDGIWSTKSGDHDLDQLGHDGIVSDSGRRIAWSDGSGWSGRIWFEYSGFNGFVRLMPSAIEVCVCRMVLVIVRFDIVKLLDAVLFAAARLGVEYIVSDLIGKPIEKGRTSPLMEYR